MKTRSANRKSKTRKKILLAVLGAVKKISLRSVDLFDVYLEAGYGASFSRLQYLLRKKEQRREKEKLLRQIRRQYTQFIYYLKRGDILQRVKEGGIDRWEITKKGEEKLKKLEKTPFQKVDYEGIPSAHYTAVIFDIPQAEQRKRAWIREALHNMGFKMVQKSVWMGKIKIPKEFVDDIFNQKMEGYVHIFKVLNKGTLGVVEKSKKIRNRY